MEELPGGRHQAPARGALAGARQDAKSSIAGDDKKAGAAWTHNFLNQKPWHPASFRNRQKVWEAEQDHLRDKKEKDQALQEFEQEQEYLKTLAYMSKEEAEKQRQRQSISFMYMKPPGYDAAQERAQKEAAQQEAAQKAALEGVAREAAAGAPGAAASDRAASGAQASTSQPHKAPASSNGPSHVAAILEGIAAARANERYTLKHHISSVGSRSPIRGGVDPTSENQQFVVGGGSSDEEPTQAAAAAGDYGLPPGEGVAGHKPSKKEAERRKLEEAKQFLLAAGLDVQGLDDVLEGAGASGKSKKKKRKSKHKKSKDKGSKRSKHGKKERRRHDSGSDSTSASDSD